MNQETWKFYLLNYFITYFIILYYKREFEQECICHILTTIAKFVHLRNGHFIFSAKSKMQRCRNTVSVKINPSSWKYIYSKKWNFCILNWGLFVGVICSKLHFIAPPTPPQIFHLKCSCFLWSPPDDLDDDASFKGIFVTQIS